MKCVIAVPVMCDGVAKSPVLVCIPEMPPEEGRSFYGLDVGDIVFVNHIGLNVPFVCLSGSVTFAEEITSMYNFGEPLLASGYAYSRFFMKEETEDDG